MSEAPRILDEPAARTPAQSAMDDGTITMRDLPLPKPASPVACVFVGALAAHAVGVLAWRLTAARHLPLSATDATIVGGIAVTLVLAVKARRPVRWRLWTGAGVMLGTLLAVASFTDIL